MALRASIGLLPGMFQHVEHAVASNFQCRPRSRAPSNGCGVVHTQEQQAQAKGAVAIKSFIATGISGQVHLVQPIGPRASAPHAPGRQHRWVTSHVHFLATPSSNEAISPMTQAPSRHRVCGLGARCRCTSMHHFAAAMHAAAPAARQAVYHALAHEHLEEKHFDDSRQRTRQQRA